MATLTSPPAHPILNLGRAAIVDLERYRLKAEASGYYDMANRLKDQIGELEKRVAEIQKHGC